MENFLFALLGKPICIQCNLCCTEYEVHHVPGYENGIKPERTACVNLKKAELKDGKWHLAQCIIHERPDYPEECKNYHGGHGLPNKQGQYPCALGLAWWQQIAKPQGGELPELVKQFENKAE